MNGPYRTKLGERGVDFLDFVFTWFGRALDFVFTWFGRAWHGFWGLFTRLGFWLAVALVTVSTLVVKVATTDGRITYCYVTSSVSNSSRSLFGHRPWRPDVELSAVKYEADPAPLYELAKKVDCPIR